MCVWAQEFIVCAIVLGLIPWLILIGILSSMFFIIILKFHSTINARVRRLSSVMIKRRKLTFVTYKLTYQIVSFELRKFERPTEKLVDRILFFYWK